MLKSTLSILFFATTLALPAPAQTTGAIHLQIEDPSGAGLHAEGAVTGPIRRSFASNARGIVELEHLPPGHYRVEIHSKGFAQQTIALDVYTQIVTCDVVLGIAGATALISVVADTPVSEGALTLDQIPLPVQTLSTSDLDDSNALDLADAMNRRMNGVYVNEMPTTLSSRTSTTEATRPRRCWVLLRD